MPRIPPVLPRLPDLNEVKVQHEPYSTIFDSLADGCNYLAGFKFLRTVPVIVAPFVRTRDGNAVDEAHERAIRFTTSSLARFLFVAVGYSAVRAGGFVNVVLRHAHATIPGAGAVIDPGCRFVRANNDLTNPVQDRAYAPSGLQWSHTGQSAPPAANVADPITQRPRVLNCAALQDVDVVVSWDDVKLNALLIAELWRPNV
jgi:hypothetical protein